MRCLAVLLLVLASGCAHHVISASSGTSSTASPAPRAAVATSGTSGLNVHATGGAATALVITMIAASAINMAAQPAPVQPVYYSTWPEVSDWFWNRPGNRAAPDMAADRKVAEQDCSKPVDLTAGNLRCR